MSPLLPKRGASRLSDGMQDSSGKGVDRQQSVILSILSAKKQNNFANKLADVDSETIDLDRAVGLAESEKSEGGLSPSRQMFLATAMYEANLGDS